MQNIGYIIKTIASASLLYVVTRKATSSVLFPGFHRLAVIGGFELKDTVHFFFCLSTVRSAADSANKKQLF